MPSPPLASQQIGLSDAVPGDPSISFSIKSEDISIPFNTYLASPDSLVPSPPGRPRPPIQSPFDSSPPHPPPPGPPPSLGTAQSSGAASVDMDILETSPIAGPSRMFLSYPPMPPQSMLPPDEMQGITSIGSPESVNTSSSSAASLAASPALPSFTNVSSSSLASALDEHGAVALLSRSRSGSLVSPNSSLQSASFPPPRTTPPRTTEEVAAAVSAIVGSAVNTAAPLDLPGLSRPDHASQSHLTVVDELKNIAVAAFTAAFTLNQTVEAANTIDEMKRRISLVSDLLAKTVLDLPPQEVTDGSGQLLANGTPAVVPSSQVQPTIPTHRATQSLPSVTLSSQAGLMAGFSPTSLSALPQGVSPMEQTMSAGSSSTSTSHSGHTPDSDNTRKRCASSMAGNPPLNRSNKALRLGPNDGTGLPSLVQVQGQPAPSPSPPAVLPGAPTTVPSSQVPLRGPLGMSAGILQQPTMILGGGAGSATMTVGGAPTSAPLPLAGISTMKTSPSAPPSRPNSPSTMRSGWPTMLGLGSQGPVVPVPAPLSTAAQPVGIGVGVGVAPPPPFSVPLPLNTVGLSSGGVSSVPSPTKSRSVWPGDLSGTSSIMTGGVPPPNVPPGTLTMGVHPETGGALPGVATLAGTYAAAPPYVSPPRINPSPIVVPNVGTARSARSSSLSGSLAFSSTPTATTTPTTSGMDVSDYVPRHSRSRARSKPSNISNSPTMAMTAVAAPERRSRSVSSDEDDSDLEGGDGSVSTSPSYALSAFGHRNGSTSALMQAKLSPPLKSRDSSRERPSQRQRINGGSGHAHSLSQSALTGEGSSGVGGSSANGGMGVVASTSGSAGGSGSSPSASGPNSAANASSSGSGGGSGANGAHGNEIPAEYRADVDRIFFEFMNRTCSNLDATDSKGEPIHQTLMAKKMQRLDESPDFRPFKFRIQAFTNGFLEELSNQGYPEEKIAMKKVRNYLWNQPFISRFNEDGKKAKSKGNHIWNIDARKKPEGGWEFRPFHRKLAGQPPPVAYAGLRWQWSPRVWDPQASRSNLPVQFSSPGLPSWLAWDDKGTLSGVPPQDAQSCDVTVEARFTQDGREEFLVQTIHINVSPMQSGTDASFAARPTLTSDIHGGRRVNSDPVVPLVTAAPIRALQPAPPPLAPTTQLSTQDAQMMQVLTSAAQRVAEEAQAHVIAAQNINLGQAPDLELQALAKQQHVLTVTAQALDEEVSTPNKDAVSPSSHALVAVAQQVVLQAARQVATDRSFAAAISNQPVAAQVTVNEVSVATQEAVAEAVNLTGPLSSEVDVLITASSLLQQKTLDPTLPSMPGNAAALAPPVLPPNGPVSAPALLPSYADPSMSVTGMDLNFLPS